MQPVPANPFPRRFVFHGNAVAAEVILKSIGGQPPPKPTQVQGQSSLPTIGGHSESLVTSSDPAFAQVFSYGECRTQADGLLKGDTAVTTLSSSVEQIRIVNRPSAGETPAPQPIEFRAGRLALAMRSTHPANGQAQIEFAAPPVFQDLSLAGRPLRIELRSRLMSLARLSDLDHAYRTDRAFFDDCRDGFMLPDPTRPPQFGSGLPTFRDHYVVTSIVRRIVWGNQQIEGHVLSVTGFGTIYFGEMLINEYNRRVTLVRMQLGSDVDAQVSFGEGDPNGTFYPPVA